MQNTDEAEIPKGVTLRDFDDFSTLRTNIFDGVKKAMIKAFPVNYGPVRMELHDVDYDNLDPVPIHAQKKTILENKYLTKKLRGTVKLFDNATDQLLEEKRLSLLRVPYLTSRGTFLHGGNEYVTNMQSRLLPGVYTRRQANGELETMFNPKPGTGAGFRIGFEPEAAQYKVKIGQANLHLYSLLKDIGTSDKELEEAWGKDIFDANRLKYDARVLDKAYDRLVTTKQKKLDQTPDDKIKSIKAALDGMQIHARVAQKNLPNLFNPKIASEWNAKWAGQQAMEKVAAEREASMPFEPDLTPDQIYGDFLTKEAIVKKVDGKWLLYTKDMSRVLGTHDSAQDAYKQEYAIQKSQEAKKKAAVVTEPADAEPVIPPTNKEKLKLLLKAKEHSDHKQYGEKKKIMALLMHHNPAEFIVDSGGRMSGITHVPTGFRMHVPRNIIPSGVQRVFEEQNDDDDDIAGLYQSKFASEDEDFDPDLMGEELTEEYNAIYGKVGPRLAGMKKWKSEWVPESSGLGWLDWFTQYSNGTRTDDDDKQIQRWKSFKARQVPTFIKNPTPRMAYSLRNWGIDGLKLIKDDKERKELEKEMEEYRSKAWEEYNEEKE